MGREIEPIKNKNMTYKNCQSCGMPHKKDPGGGGTEADGTKSVLYCSYCYESGNFRQANLTAHQMQDFVKGKMHEMGFPRFLAWLFTRQIPQLQRWKK